MKNILQNQKKKLLKNLLIAEHQNYIKPFFIFTTNGPKELLDFKIKMQT